MKSYYVVIERWNKLGLGERKAFIRKEWNDKNLLIHVQADYPKWVITFFKELDVVYD